MIAQFRLVISAKPPYQGHWRVFGVFHVAVKELQLDVAVGEGVKFCQSAAGDVVLDEGDPDDLVALTAKVVAACGVGGKRVQGTF